MTTYNMQLTDWQVGYSGSGYFQFPINPQVISFPLTMDRNLIEVPYALHHVIITGGGIKAREFVLQGTFKGDTRLTDYNSFAAKVIAKDMTKLFLNSDSFYYVTGSGIRQALAAEKSKFIDYVATFLSMSPFVYSTARTNSMTKTSAGPWNTSALTNTGTADSVAKITVANSSSAEITSVIIGDGATIGTSTHTLTWTKGTTGILSGQSLIIYPFKLWNATGVGDVMSVRFGHPEIGGVQSGNSLITGGSVPRVTAGTSSQVFSIQLVGCNGSTTVTLDWFDANVG